MEEKKALHLTDLLRDRGVDAHLEPSTGGIHGFGVRIDLHDGRQAIWGAARTTRLEAEVMRDGVLVGFREGIVGSENFSPEQIIEAITATDWSEPVAHRSARPAPVAPPLRREGGVFRRFLGGFRE
ncbi:MAG TPA: hypothetical protein VHV82_23360 [Sporichthyaceae bacterium]|nr:hypothetical protein [Sporichthyaceae bacterium]